MKLIRSKAEFIKQEPGLDGIYKAIELAGRTCYRSQDKITEDSAKGFVERMIKSGHTAMLEHGTVYLKMPVKYIDVSCELEIPIIHDLVLKYMNNLYSRVFIESTSEDEDVAYVITNYRVLIENNWIDDLQYLCEPTHYHEKRYTVRFTTDQGILRELTRSRSMSFAVESTRYCNYSKDKYGNELTFIIPSWSKIKELTCKFDELVDVYKSPYDPYDTIFINGLIEAEAYYISLTKNLGMEAQKARQLLPLATKCDVVMTGFASDWKFFLDLRYFEKTGKVHPDMLELTNKLKNELVNAGVWDDIMNHKSRFE